MDLMPPRLAALAGAQHGLFTTAQALDCGFSSPEITRLARRNWHRLRRGVYCERERYDRLDDIGRHRLAVHAVLLKVTCDVAVSHVSSAVLHGLPVHDADLSRVHLTRPDLRCGRDEAGVRFHVATVLDEERVIVDGAPALDLARTAVDVARMSTFRCGVVTADAALRRGATPEQLKAALARSAHWLGARTAGRVVAFADGRAETPGESLARVAMVEDGLPVPDLQRTLRDADGFVGRVDFVFDDHRTVVEFDGLVKYKLLEGMSKEEASAVLVAEKRREDRIRPLGYEVVRLVWTDLHQPGRVGALVRAGFARALARRSA
jgi:predicted transcriptional regulator of viral defense system